MSSKHVLLGISGGIAAYKSLTLIRLFRKNGYEVKVVATSHALEFVSSLTIETLSDNKLYHNMFDTNLIRTTEHVSLAQWADVMVVAPATANCLAKFANGIADDALSTVFLACNKPVFLAPAMNENMLSNCAVVANIQTLQKRGINFIESEAGFLACNTQGQGRMAEPEQIFARVESFLKTPTRSFRALVTAAGTQEPIDAVRYIGNRSSGLMGFCIAEAFADKGVEVDLITAPTNLQTKNPHINTIPVQTAAQMLEACKKTAPQVQVMVMAAAVADYTPQTVVNNKMKKQTTDISLNLVPTVDILKTLSANKKQGQLLVGFALETDNEIENAKAKLHSKNLDMIILNSLNDKGAGFGTSTNKVTIIEQDDTMQTLPLLSKQEVATIIVEKIMEKCTNSK